MTERSKQIEASLKILLPKLSELDRERLLMYGEGMAVKTEDFRRTMDSAPQRPQV